MIRFFESEMTKPAEQLVDKMLAKDKMKTAMQELKDKLLTTTFLSPEQMMGIRPILETLIEKEKQQIINAYSNGSPEFFDLADDYYNQVYNQNEE